MVLEMLEMQTCECMVKVVVTMIEMEMMSSFLTFSLHQRPPRSCLGGVFWTVCGTLSSLAGTLLPRQQGPQNP